MASEHPRRGGLDEAAAVAAERRALLPEPRLVAAWFGFAHGSLLLAALLVAVDAELLAATFYHPRCATDKLEVLVTYFDVPPGGSVRVDAEDPGTCDF